MEPVEQQVEQVEQVELAVQAVQAELVVVQAEVQVGLEAEGLEAVVAGVAGVGSAEAVQAQEALDPVRPELEQVEQVRLEGARLLLLVVPGPVGAPSSWLASVASVGQALAAGPSLSPWRDVS